MLKRALSIRDRKHAAAGATIEEAQYGTEASQLSPAKFPSQEIDQYWPHTVLPVPSEPPPCIDSEHDIVRGLPQYEYSPLPTSDSIRLLEILPRQSSGVIRCRLITAKLASFPSYEALSYTWGDPTHKIPVDCDGFCLEINVNLHCALISLADRTHTGAVWADAICINQSDVAERSQQVNLMRQLYENAEQVIVWLGREDKATAHIAFEIIRRTVDYYDARYESTGDFKDAGGPPVVLDPIFHNAGWAPVEQLVSLGWFRRVWVQQEIGLARKAMVVWGQKAIAWSYIVEFALLHWQVYDFRKVYLTRNISHIVNSFTSIWATYKLTNSWKTERPYTRMISGRIIAGRTNMLVSHGKIAQILSDGRRFNSTDPRDHIFGFLGHPAARVTVNGGGHELVHVDYAEPLREVCLRASRKILTETQSLLLLSCVQHTVKTLEAPDLSWVPRWNLDVGAEVLGLLIPETDKFYDASRSKSSALQRVHKLSALRRSHNKKALKPSFDLIGNTLKVTGFVFDEITHFSSAYPVEEFARASTAGADRAKFTNPVEDIWLRFVTRLPRSSSPYDNLSLAFSCCLRGGLNFQNEPLEDNSHALQSSFHAYLIDKCKLSEKDLRKLDFPVDDGNVEPSLEFMSEGGTRWLAGRRFFAVTKGYFGLGPVAMDYGDLVCVIFGARVPFVLRPTDVSGQYKLVGECFVQALMRGEAMDLALVDRRLPEQSFEIV